MNGKGKHIRVPQHLYERLKRRSELEGKSIGEVLSDLLNASGAFETSKKDEEGGLCVLCGRTTRRGKICDECFYSPDIIRPQVMGVLFLDFHLRVLHSTGSSLNFEDFIALMDEETAKAHGITDKEWREWCEWLEWRKRHKEDPTLRHSKEWKVWVIKHPTRYERHAGHLLFKEKIKKSRELLPIGEILRQTFPQAFAGLPRRQEENEAWKKESEAEKDEGENTTPPSP